MKTSVDVDRVAVHARGSTASEEGHHAANFCDINQSMGGNSGGHEFFEFRDAICCAASTGR